METVKLTLCPLSAFGTRLVGDTLFGQLCWAVRNRFGEDRLRELLAGYTENRPYAVISDAFPSGYLPRPSLPQHWFEEVADEDRKAVKKRAWLPIDKFEEPLAAWLSHCKAGGEIPGAAPLSRPQAHNTIDRRTGTTGTDQFAPYAMSQLWFGQDLRRCGQRESGSDSSPEVRLDIYVVVDETRLGCEDLRLLLSDMGSLGFGRDASIGLGKFRLDHLENVALPGQQEADAWMTLAPCAPQRLGFDALRSFYQVFTRFGRHGDIGVYGPNPFKSPVLLAQTGAVLSPYKYESTAFVGQGLGGDGSLSRSIPGTVQQGYAPVVGIRLPVQEAAP